MFYSGIWSIEQALTLLGVVSKYIDYEHSIQGLTGHEKAKKTKGIYRIKI